MDNRALKNLKERHWGQPFVLPPEFSLQDHFAEASFPKKKKKAIEEETVRFEDDGTLVIPNSQYYENYFREEFDQIENHAPVAVVLHDGWHKPCDAPSQAEERYANAKPHKAANGKEM